MSAPELSGGPADDLGETRPQKRWKRWLVVIGVVLVILGLIVSLTGVWQLFQPAQTRPTDVELELPATPVGAAFGDQTPKWTDCGDGFECADVHAPLDWSEPEGETIRLRMVKHPATGGAPLGTLFVNPGGPGASGVEYVRNALDSAVGEPLRRNFDVVGWDPRGVGASSPVSCLSAKDMDDYLFGVSDSTAKRGSAKWIEEAVASSRDYGEACLEKTGDLLGHVDTVSTVRDLDMLREIQGDEQLNYLGYSYGTHIGARYAEMFPDRVGKLVLDGVLDPTATEADVVREQTRGFELALRSYVTACLGAKECPLSGTVDEAMGQISALLDDVDATPIVASDGRTLTTSTMLTAIITPLYAESNWGYLNSLFASVAEGDADIAFALADSYYGRLDGEYLDNSTEAFQAINCLDYPNAVDPERMREEAAELEKIAPTIGRFQGYGDVSCAGWPFKGVDERAPVKAAGADPILVVGTTGDPATPYKWAEALAEQLESGVLVRYEGEGHTAYGQNSCVNSVVESYFVDGVVPESGVSCS
ncbi:alpha/beta hydrolase family protein [Leucobacter komagatae]|uniref:Alpha/beta hydrolase family protein n=1 Tax=Leucobacter komagatae TaxID=55969 RepID=A0A542Y7F0_9MICO|nr:alpha/beta hydrolase [Leucobacter komagatae]TQL44032.1 alpha/beta hydrolase family protein [Leucobacter komagatae]